MNRVIKFRAWDKQRKSMHTVSSILFYCDPIEIDHDGNMGEHKSVEHFELMQFTGLTDKNGHEIYEGDILYYQFEDSMYESVKWDADLACFVTSENGFIGGDLSENSEVIGNIHENPELICLA
jgi:uncharacterized phage protein (TIGR01671 family)